MSDSWTVKDSEYIVPPQDSYVLDLLFIERVPTDRADRDDYYRWHWKISDVAGQEKYAAKGCRATSQTPITPTTGNRFGAFLKVLYGKLEVNQTGSLQDLIFANYRVKGFLKHNKQKGTDNVFCNIDTLIEDTVKKGEGEGIKGSYGKLRATVNAWLESIGKKPLDDAESQTTQAKETEKKKEEASPATSAPKTGTKKKLW
jgi:hypothetical protein